MHIVTCFKVVPEEQDIVVTPDSNNPYHQMYVAN